MGRPKSKWMSYAAAKVTVREAGIVSRNKYWKWWDKNEPIGLSRFPYRVYTEWTTWQDFLGTENPFIIKQKGSGIQYMPYSEAMRYMHTRKDINTRAQYYANCKPGHRTLPKNLPYRPDLIYKDKGWMGWAIYLGKNAAARVESAKINTSLLALCQPKNLPQGYLSFVMAESEHELKSKLDNQESGMMRVIKLYKWEKTKTDWLSGMMQMNGTAHDDNQWLVRNPHQVLSELDNELLWYSPTQFKF